MDLGYVVAIALIAVMAVAAIVLFKLTGGIHSHRTTGTKDERVRWMEVDDPTLRNAVADLEQRLAVQEQKVARPIEIEGNVLEKSTQTKIALIQAQARLSEQVLEAKDLAQRYETLKDIKAALEQSLAARTEALTRVEALANDLGARLAEAENAGQETASRLEVSRAEAGDLEIKCAKLQEALDQVVKQSEEKLALLNEAKGRMTEEFKLLAEEVIRRHAAAFTKQNNERVSAILAPLREKLTEFQQSLDVTHIESAKGRTLLAEQIRVLSETSARMTDETLSLARALRGKSPTQGAWGEMVLSTILERSGLREGEEYSTAETLVAKDGSRLRPDVLVSLPNGERIVIDSKVSLTAFEAYVNCETDAERAFHLSSHVSSIRSHIKTLAGKEYQRISDNGLDYVIMFVPIEGAFAAALQEDPALICFAAEYDVAIATPATLMMALRTVANVWRVEGQNRNAEAIAEQAGRLYDKFVGFLGDMHNLGHLLGKAQESYDGAMGKLSTGRGNLIRQVEQLREMGAKTSKSSPEALPEDVQMQALPSPTNVAA